MAGQGIGVRDPCGMRIVDPPCPALDARLDGRRVLSFEPILERLR